MGTQLHGRARAALTRGFLLLVLGMVALEQSSPAATSSTVVGATVLSATQIDAAACGAGVAGTTEFGTIVPGASLVTTQDCVVKFGSSNNTAQLRIRQDDRVGTAMWSPTTGRLDVGFDGPAAPGNGAFVDDRPGMSHYGITGVVDHAGRSVVIGTCDDYPFYACFARYLDDGSLDVTFDGPSGTGNGRFQIAVNGVSDWMLDSIMQPDGKILVVGSCWVGVGTVNAHCFIRLNSDGTLDTTFDGPGGNGNGEFEVDLSAQTDGAWGVDLQADGRIVVAGQCNTSLCMSRYLPDGSLDPTFDGPSGTGNGAFSVVSAGGVEWGRAVAVQSNGRIVVAGRCANGTDNDMCFARFLADGAWDTTFDGPSGTGNGRFLLPMAVGDQQADDIAVLDGGSIVSSGICDYGATDEHCVVRLTTVGALDMLYARTNTPAQGAGGDPTVSLYAAPDQTLLVAGTCTGASNADMCVIRYRADGLLDTTFDGSSGTGNGVVLIPVGATSDSTRTVRQRTDGRIALLGTCTGSVDADFCAASLDSEGTFSDYVTGTGSDRDWTSDPAATSMFGVCLRDVTGGAVDTWIRLSCGQADGPAWHAVPATSEQVATTAALEPDPADAAVMLRFGIRVAGNQPPARYIAPIAFDVLAPSV